MTTEAADPSFRAAGIAPGSIDGVPMHRGELRMMAAEAKWQDQEAEKKKLPTQHKHGMQFEGGYVRPAASDDLEGAAPGGDAGSATPFQPLARKDYMDRWYVRCGDAPETAHGCGRQGAEAEGSH